MVDAVPYFDLKRQFANLRDEILPALERVCETCAFASGPEVKAFEDAFAAYCGTTHAIGVSSGTSALHVALRCADVEPGDEVITTPYTFISTTWAISYCGATPVFVDVDPTTRNLDPAKLAAAITERTKVVLPVHLYGLPADIDAITAIAAPRGVTVIEDAAQAQGAAIGGTRAGGLGRMACFSFYPGKNLGAYGEGGAITTNDPEWAARAARLRDHGQTERYYHDELAFNYRMDGFQGAVLAIKLAHLDAWNRRRAEIAARYTDAFGSTALGLPSVPDGFTSAWHLYVVETEDRDRFRAHLESRGVPTALHYPVCLHEQKPYRHLGYARGDFPNAEHLADRVVSLPFFPEMTDDEVAHVIDAVRAF